jgi:hypothetical protein
VRDILPVAERDRVQRLIRDRLEDWTAYYRSQWHWEERTEANMSLNQMHGLVDDFGAERESTCAELLTTPDGLLARIEREIRAELTERQQQAWGLGVCVDQALHPHDALRHVNRVIVPEPDQLAPGRHWADVPRDARPQGPKNFLLNYNPRPGELPADPSWHDDVRQRWRELGITYECPPCLPPCGEEVGTTRMVAQVDEATRTGLLVLEHPGQAGQERSHTPEPARRHANDARDSWLYGQCVKGTRYRTIISQLKKKVQEGRRWLLIGSPQGVRAAVARYCTRHNKPLPTPRQGK